MQEALSGAWAPQPILSVESLGTLHGLNSRFLDLLSASTADWRGSSGLAVPGSLRELVAALSPEQRAAAARCPYALFDLRFDDDAYWRSRLAPAGSWRVRDQTGAADPAADFVRLALFYAWHVAATATLGAELLLGMTEPTASAFRGVTLDRLPVLMSSESCAVTARWPRSGSYWSALALAAASSDAVRLRQVQLFGLQLAATARVP